MKINPQLENLVAHAQIVQDQLYEIQDELSEATYLMCFNNCQSRLRELGYKHVAMAFMLMNGHYQEWRMQHPFNKKIYNIRRVNHLGHEMLMGECEKGSTKGRFCDSYSTLIEGNTIHKRD